jgi:hypothetical protein
MPSVKLHDVPVDVGETELPEPVQLDSVFVGEIERDIEADVDPVEFVEACSSDEIYVALYRMHEDEYIGRWLADQDVNTLREFKPIIDDALLSKSAEEEERVRTDAEALLENMPAMPTSEVARMLRTIADVTKQELAAFPKQFLNELSEKLGDAANPIVSYEIPPNLRTILNAMEPGEVNQEFINELKAQVNP